jgi:hypothetical protein
MRTCKTVLGLMDFFGFDDRMRRRGITTTSVPGQKTKARAYERGGEGDELTANSSVRSGSPTCCSRTSLSAFASGTTNSSVRRWAKAVAKVMTNSNLSLPDRSRFSPRSAGSRDASFTLSPLVSPMLTCSFLLRTLDPRQH